MRRRGQSQCLWARARAGDGEARAGRLQDFLCRRYRRSARGALARARRHDLRARRLYARIGATAFIEINARPVINSTTELAEWDAFVSAHAWRGGAALHVDTGMHRLGISPDEAAALAPRAQTENHGIALLMSHLACAEIADHPLNAKQIQLFRELHMLYRGLPASLANSSGIFLGDSAHFDLARPGAALYGVNPTPGRPNPMQSVVELTGRILQLRSVARDETVGYGATWTAKRPSRIAVVALGYADGLLRAGSGTDERPAAPPSSPVIAARSSAAFRWTWSASTSPIFPTAAVHRGDRRHAHRRRHHASTTSPRPPAPSAMRFSPGSARAAISSIGR